MRLSARLAAGPALGGLPITDELLTMLSDATEGFSGAEIEQAVISGCFDAFDGRRALTADDLLREIDHTVPLSITQSEQIDALRAWAGVRRSAGRPGRRPGSW